MLCAMPILRPMRRRVPAIRSAERTYMAFTVRPVTARTAAEARASSIVDGSYLALVSDQNLRTTVIAGRPEMGAPDWRGDVPGKPMSPEDVSDVVAWLAAQRPQFPASLSLRNGRNSMSAPDGLSRRGMLMKLGILFNGAVGVVLAVPIVRYLLSPVIRERKPGYESWLSLGPLDQFPEGQTRLATYRNPSRESIGWGNREYSLLGA